MYRVVFANFNLVWIVSLALANEFFSVIMNSWPVLDGFESMASFVEVLLNIRL